MKETKVYVDELPESCSKCVCVDDCYCGITQKNIYYEFYEWTKPKDCPLIDIKTHDRELVKKVCEKIKRNVRVTRIKNKWFAFEDDLRNILDQIQEEFKK